MYEVIHCMNCGDVNNPRHVPDGPFEYRLECPNCGAYVGYETHAGYSYIPEEDNKNNNGVENVK